MPETRNIHWFVLIHEADPQSRPLIITFFTRDVRTYVPTFQNLAKQNNSQLIIVTATGYFGSVRVDH